MQKNTNKTLKIAFILVLLALIGTIGFTTSYYNKSKSNEAELVEEKSQIMDDLNRMVKQYDEAIATNTITNDNLADAKARIEGLIDSLKTSKASVNSLLRFKRRYFNLQKEMTTVIAQNDSLKVENQLLSTNLETTTQQLNENIASNDSLASQNSQLANRVKNASVLQPVGLKSFGVIERRSGKQITTKRARRSDKIKICYTVAKNSLVNEGQKAFYVQVIDPNSNVLGENKTINFGDKVLKYSLISSFEYLKKSMDMCEYVSPPVTGKFEKGTYYVSVFDEDKKVNAYTFSLD